MADEQDVPTERGLLRVSDAEREAAAGRLQAAVGEGRLSLEELDRRVAALYAARTRGEMEAVTADLPVEATPKSLRIHRVKSLSRIDGRWQVPAVLTVDCYDALVRLDFRQAAFVHPEVRIELSATKSLLRLRLPPGAVVDANGLVFHKAFVRNRVRPAKGVPGGARFVVTGQLVKGMLILR
ncbi:hypothetical protein FHS39_004250 [Streptomyces olivoverticillatus]|uniref:DUF1707 domain-containing protein n=1 Tax=Streptomyces olivoverticillatus TaxID=66427 RepID=A0A7W7LSW3_9ACTN|nr:DUF1707 domain-containing protein [Streptomyces olivoverticillatus]MBB4895183.1 hypothetical protein [Streptomyces olivoverticillatus]